MRSLYCMCSRNHGILAAIQCCPTCYLFGVENRELCSIYIRNQTKLPISACSDECKIPQHYHGRVSLRARMQCARWYYVYIHNVPASRYLRAYVDSVLTRTVVVTCLMLDRVSGGSELDSMRCEATRSLKRIALETDKSNHAHLWMLIRMFSSQSQ